MAGSVTVQSALTQFLSTDSLDRHRRKVCSRLMDCRTARMGGMEMRCDPLQSTNRALLRLPGPALSAMPESG